MQVFGHCHLIPGCEKFIYIKDVVNANITLAKTESARINYSLNKYIVNVGTGVSTDVESIAKEILNKYNCHLNKINYKQNRAGDILNSYSDVSLLNYIFNTSKPHYKFNIKSALSRMLEFD